MTEVLQGRCLCGNVAFQVSGPLPKIYQCHCSLCRKVSGAASNAAFLVSVEVFEWVCGKQDISSYSTESGFKSDFCSQCGSPVPNLTKDRLRYWVPAGLLDQSDRVTLAAHVYVDSKAEWDRISHDVPHFKEMPDEKTLKTLLNHSTAD